MILQLPESATQLEKKAYKNNFWRNIATVLKLIFSILKMSTLFKIISVISKQLHKFFPLKIVEPIQKALCIWNYCIEREIYNDT